jgi:hypothetical protein
MYRLLVTLILIGLVGAPLSAQALPSKESLAVTPTGKYRVEIFSPAPRGTWSALIVISAVNGHYEGSFGNPDGPETYPVASVEVNDKSLTITMAGEATGSVFSLTITGDSLVGTMTSTVNGLTPVRGVRVRQ